MNKTRIMGSVLLIIFRSLISLCFITCLIRISFNLKKDQKNRPRDSSNSFEVCRVAREIQQMLNPGYPWIFGKLVVSLAG